jgi:hypothetical protein
MDYKTIKIENQEYFLVPRIESSQKVDGCDITIEMVGLETKKYVYVKVKGIWGAYEPQKGQPWMTYHREEKEDMTFTWYRTSGGHVTARTEDMVILESWYQKSIKC